MVTVGMTVGLAFVGYMATYLNGLRLGQRQARLVRINQQLSEFYGPLLALMEANQRTFDAFHADFALADGRCPICDVPVPAERDLAEWQCWATTVFIPNIRAMRDVVVTKADLLIESEMPAVLLELCAHVSGYEVTLARWSEGNRGQHVSIIKFPAPELHDYTRDRFARLKLEQSRLLGRQRL
ncbi:hypothetical protein [Nocardia sp. NPDC056000]|uniref:hypothetical protein n=1 Tax=Nocardia sp. NPDC056000 TaxID=3345674 RepID=UPI0035DF2911